MTGEESIRIESFIDSLGAACLILTDTGLVRALNGRAEDLYCVKRGEIVGHPFGELCAESDRRIVECTLSSCNGSAREFTARALRPDSSSFLGEFTATRHVLSGGGDLLVIIARKLEEDLNTCQTDLELHHLMLEHALDGIVAHTIDGELLFANNAAEEQWGATVDEVRRLGPWGWVATASRPSVSMRVSQMLEHGQARFESRRVLDDGRVVHQEVHSRIVETAAGKIVVATTRDITERVEAEEMVRHLAYHDMLTGLANRRALDNALRHAIVSADRYDDLVGIVFLDLDDFKPINDTYGHVVGDEVLREVSQRLTECVRECDTVARLGGDEFVVVLPRLPEVGSLISVATKLVEAVTRPIHVKDELIFVQPSIGTALRRQGEDAEALLTRADLQMYEARELRKALPVGAPFDS